MRLAHAISIVVGLMGAATCLAAPGPPDTTGYLLPWNREPHGSEVDLAPAGEPGQRFQMSGRVFAVDDSTPLVGVRVYFYHADAKGLYTKPGAKRDVPRLAGVSRTNERGEYVMRSVVPGQYGDEPPHVHLEVWGANLPRRIAPVSLHPALGTPAPMGWTVRPLAHGSPPWVEVATMDSSGAYQCIHDIHLKGMVLSSAGYDSLRHALETRLEHQTASGSGARSNYPAHWWTPVPHEGAPAWEILPQEAGPGEVILSKRNELGLLSNFAPTPFTFRGHRYASLEGFWQMMLYPEDAKDPRATYPGLQWKYTREQVAGMTSFEAKKAGDLAEENMCRMNIGWVSFEGRRFDYRSPTPAEHYRLIVAATHEKVRQNAEVQRVLLSTGDLTLRPDHHQEPDAPPEWRYFEILTRIREGLREKKAGSP